MREKLFFLTIIQFLYKIYIGEVARKYKSEVARKYKSEVARKYKSEVARKLHTLDCYELGWYCVK